MLLSNMTGKMSALCYATILPVFLLTVSIRSTESSVFPHGFSSPAANSMCSHAPSNEILKDVENALYSVNEDLTQLYGPPCSCGRGSPWTRVAFLNMSDPNQECPSNWTLNFAGVRGCGRSSTGTLIADSAFYPVNGITYSKVCGRVIGYQGGVTDAFYPYYRLNQSSIEQPYVDGVSLTYGPAGSRHHIWTFIDAISEREVGTGYEVNQCICSNINYNWAFKLPPFMNNSYFCDTGDLNGTSIESMVYSNKPLWEGRGCGPNSSCCQFNSPPWFCTTLLEPTSDDLEFRIMLSEAYFDEDVIVSLIDVYVQK